MTYTFEELLAMDMYAWSEAVGKMTEEERKAIVIPAFDSVQQDKNLREAIARLDAKNPDKS